ncbi:hypothetical protein HK102_001480, partial [Quaeritorhiza haematococci]
MRPSRNRKNVDYSAQLYATVSDDDDDYSGAKSRKSTGRESSSKSKSAGTPSASSSKTKRPTVVVDDDDDDFMDMASMRSSSSQSQPSQTGPRKRKSLQEKKEEAELKLALELSKKEIKGEARSSSEKQSDVSAYEFDSSIEGSSNSEKNTRQLHQNNPSDPFGFPSTSQESDASVVVVDDTHVSPPHPPDQISKPDDISQLPVDNENPSATNPAKEHTAPVVEPSSAGKRFTKRNKRSKAHFTDSSDEEVDVTSISDDEGSDFSQERKSTSKKAKRTQTKAKPASAKKKAGASYVTVEKGVASSVRTLDTTHATEPEHPKSVGSRSTRKKTTTIPAPSTTTTKTNSIGTISARASSLQKSTTRNENAEVGALSNTKVSSNVA